MPRNTNTKQRGMYKLAVYFVNHSTRFMGKPFYAHSTVQQDRAGNKFVPRMRDKIDTGDWNGKIQWACFYMNGEAFLEYNSDTQTWGSPRPKAT